MRVSILFSKFNCFGISFFSLFLCFPPAFFMGGIVNNSHNNECENDQLDFLEPPKIICLAKGLRNGIKGWKPAKRFMIENLNINGEKIKQCKKIKESIETDYYWAHFVKSDEMPKWNVTTSLSNNTFSLTMETAKNNLALEVPDLIRRGAFLADFAGNATVFYFIFSHFLPHLVGPPSFETKTTETTPTTTNNNTTKNTPSTTTSEPLQAAESYKFYKPITNGTTVRFKAKVDDGAKAFTIRMLHDAPKFHPLIGATLLQLEVNLDPERTVTWSAFGNQQKLLERSEHNVTMFKAGTSFDCLIIVTEIIVQKEGKEVEKPIHFHIMVDGKNLGNFTGNLPIWTLNWIQIHGDIKLYDRPKINANETSGLFKYELKHLLHDTDVLCIVGKYLEPYNNFRLFLFHEANEPNNKIGETVMQIAHETKNDQKVFTIKSFLHEDMTEIKKYYPWSISKDEEDMTVKIRVVGVGYVVQIQGRREVKFEDTRIPPWAANWLTVQGAQNVTLSDNKTRCMDIVGQKNLSGNILQLYHPRSNNTFQKLLRVNDRVKISGVVDSKQVEVYLFRGALEFNEKFGQTVLRIQFDASIGKLTFNSYISKKWAYPEEDKNGPNSRALEPPLVVGGKFELKIDVVTEETFALFYGDYALYETGTMPCWAVDYIVVKGLKVPEKANLVTVEKELERNGC